MIIVLLRTKQRADADTTAYEALGARMFELVQTIAGFLGAASYTDGNGGELGVIRFASLDALRAWREHPEHLEAQHRGKTEFYAAYTIEVCDVVRAYDFTAQSTTS